MNFNAANTIVDANGQQFYMIPVNSAQNQFQPMNFIQSGNANVFSSGRLGGSGQCGQIQGYNGGHLRRGFTKHSGIFYTYCVMLLL